MTIETPQTHVARRATLRAAGWMCGAVVSFTAMAVAGREAGRQLDAFEIMTFRAMVGFAIVVAVGAFFGRLHTVASQRLLLHFTRNAAHFAAQSAWLVALTLIPLAEVFALEFTYPIWVVLLSPIFLRDRLTRIRVVAVLIGFAGILVVTRPGLVPVSDGALAAVAAAVGIAVATMTTKKLTRDQTVICILFWFTLMQIFMGLITAGWDGDLALPPVETLPFIATVGVAGLTGHYCLANALMVAPASVVAPMDFLRLPVGAVLGAILYSEAIDPFVLLGGLLILAANYLNIRWGTPASSAPPPVTGN